jgi:hypothetical protein
MRSGEPVRLPANQVLVTVGTPCTLSALGSADTHRAIVTGDKHAIGFAACDAGLVAVDAEGEQREWTVFVRVGVSATASPSRSRRSRRAGSDPARQHGHSTPLAPPIAEHLLTDIAAPLSRSEHGGSRRLAGLTFADLRRSS